MILLIIVFFKLNSKQRGGWISRGREQWEVEEGRTKGREEEKMEERFMLK